MFFYLLSKTIVNSIICYKVIGLKKGKIIRQTTDIFVKIVFAFILVFLLFILSEMINNFAYDYFVFPFLSIIIIFVCGVNVGKSLEKMKNNESIGFFTKIKAVENNEKTEFYINDKIQIITNKKILKEVEDGDKVHIKTFNYDEINLDKKEQESEN